MEDPDVIVNQLITNDIKLNSAMNIEKEINTLIGDTQQKHSGVKVALSLATPRGHWNTPPDPMT